MTTLTQNSPTVSSFNFDPHSVRVITVDGNPWFVAPDVCNALGLTNSRMTVQALDEDEKGVSSIYTPGGKQQVTVISESGLYILILRCRDAMTPGSVPYKFRKWVTSEVLPAIRRTGSYTLPAPVVQRDYLTNADMLNLKRLIWSLTGHMRNHRAAVQTIWKTLRERTGVPSPAPFEVCHLPTLQCELRRVFEITMPLRDAIDEAELVIIRRLLNHNDDAHPVLKLALNEVRDAAQGERTRIDAIWAKFFNAESRALLNREPVDNGATFPECNEPVDNFHSTHWMP